MMLKEDLKKEHLWRQRKSNITFALRAFDFWKIQVMEMKISKTLLNSILRILLADEATKNWNETEIP